MRLTRKRANTLLKDREIPSNSGHYSCDIHDLRKIYKVGFEDGLDAGQCSYRFSQRLDKMQREGARRCQKRNVMGTKGQRENRRVMHKKIGKPAEQKENMQHIRRANAVERSLVHNIIQPKTVMLPEKTLLYARNVMLNFMDHWRENRWI